MVLLMQLPKDDPIVVIEGLRTPIGQIAKSLAQVSPPELMSQTIRALLEKLRFDPSLVKSVVIGWVGQDVQAPNIARVAILKSGLPEETPGFTVQCNCISSIEAMASAARLVLAGEADVVLAGGVESMSTFPYTIQGSRSAKALRSMDTVKDNWANLWLADGVLIADTIDQGLTDPVKLINMAGTAEVCAQMYGISRDDQDKYVQETFSRCLAGEKRGFYATHTFPVKNPKDGALLLERDEYPYLRESLVEKPALIFKAPVLFDSSFMRLKDFYQQFGPYMDGTKYEEGKSKATVTLFNSCARSDGAASTLVMRLSRAKTFKLPIAGIIRSWGFYGNNPAHMGVSPALATNLALERAGINFQDLDQIELHEPFAATVLSIFKVAQQKFGHNWQAKWLEKRLNPNGGSIPLGHPLGATGIRLMLNLTASFKENPSLKYGLITACAGGGVGGAMIFEKA